MSKFKIGSGELSVKSNSNSKVIIRKDIELVGIGVLPGYTEYDFSNIPEKYHEIFLQAIQTL